MKYFTAMNVGWMRVRKMEKSSKAEEREARKKEKEETRRNTGRSTMDDAISPLFWVSLALISPGLSPSPSLGLVHSEQASQSLWPPLRPWGRCAPTQFLLFWYPTWAATAVHPHSGPRSAPHFASGVLRPLIPTFTRRAERARLPNPNRTEPAATCPPTTRTLAVRWLSHCPAALARPSCPLQPCPSAKVS